MKPKMFLVALSWLILLSVSIIGLKNNWAAGQGSSKSISQDEISERLDKIINNQERILSRLDAVEQKVIHEIRVRATR